MEFRSRRRGVAAPLGCGLRAEQRAVVPCTVYVCKFKYILLVRGHVWVVSRHVCVICYARSLRPLRGVRTATLRACGVRPTLRCAAVRALRLLHVQLATRESWAWCLVRFCACERGSGLALRLGPDSARFLPLNRAPAERNEELTVIFASVAAQLTEAVEPTARPRRPREACFRGAIRSTPPSSAYASASPSSSTSSRPAARP